MRGLTPEQSALQEARKKFIPTVWNPDGRGAAEAIRMNHAWAVFAMSLVDAFESFCEESAGMARS